MKGCDNIGWSPFLIPVLNTVFLKGPKGIFEAFICESPRPLPTAPQRGCRSIPRTDEEMSSLQRVLRLPWGLLSTGYARISELLTVSQRLSPVEETFFSCWYLWSYSSGQHPQLVTDRRRQLESRLVIFNLSQISRGVTWGWFLWWVIWEDLGISLRPPIFSNTDRPPVCVNAVNEGGAGIINNSKHCASLHTLWKTFYVYLDFHLSSEKFL